MSLSTTYGYTYPTYLITNDKNTSNINPVPVILTSGYDTVGSINILNNGAIITPSNPLPVYLNSNAITITGSVTIPATVTVDSSSNDPVHVHLEQQLPPGSNTIGGIYIIDSSNGNIISKSNPLQVSLNSAIVNVAPISTSNIIGSVLLANSSNYIGYVGISNSVQLPVTIASLPTASNIIGTVYIQTSNNTTIPVINMTASNFIGYVGISNSVPLPVILPTASNIIGSVNILNNGSNINSNNPINVSLDGTIINAQIIPSSNIIGSVNILTNFSNITNQNPVITQPSSMLLDAFGRNRISDCFTLGDYKHIYGIDPNFSDYTSNGGSVSFVKNKACCTLATSMSNNSSVIHQTRLYHNYQPGKSHLIKSSICLGVWQSNVTKRTGYYDDNDGIFFEQSGSNGILSFNIRSFVTSSPVTTSIAQSNWNIDPLDGTGPSGIILDITKTQLFFTDFQWLGVGRVRCGFAINGTLIECHDFYNANKLSTVYMTNPTLPIRCEVFNIAQTATGGSMDQICSTVISEGGYIETGIDYAINSPITTLASSVTPQGVCVIALKLANSYFGYCNHVTARLNNIQVTSLDQPLAYNVIKLDSASNYISGGTWNNVDSNSAVQYNVTMTGITGQLTNVLTSGCITAGGNGANSYGATNSGPASVAKRNFIAQNIKSTDSQAYAVYCSNLNTANNNPTRVIVSLQWREVY